MQKIKLNNNLECPTLGIGTYMLSPDEAYHSTLEALKMGLFRFIIVKITKLYFCAFGFCHFAFPPSLVIGFSSSYQAVHR